MICVSLFHSKNLGNYDLSRYFIPYVRRGFLARVMLKDQDPLQWWNYKLPHQHCSAMP